MVPPNNGSTSLSADATVPISGRLLIVDDEVELTTALREMLTERGYEAVGCVSGLEALRLLHEQEFDLLLTDLMMPDMNGITLLRAGLESDPYLAGVIMTGQGTVQTAVEAMQTGAVDYIMKPFKLDAVLLVLTRAQKARRLHLENVQLRETVAIHDFSRTIASSLDSPTIVEKAVDAALQQCEADEASILLLTPAGDELIVAAVRGRNREALLGRRVPLTQGIVGWVARSREPLVLHGEVHEPRFAPLHPRPDIRSALSLPMIAGDHLVGVLNVSLTRRRHPFAAGQIKTLQILTGAVAAALESAALYKEAERLRVFNTGIVDTVAEGIVFLDPDGRIALANPRALTLLGYTAEELQGRYWPKIGPSSQLLVVAAHGAQSAGAVNSFRETTLLTKAGRAVPVMLAVAPFIQHGQFTGALATFMDIADRKQTETQLARTLEEVRALNARVDTVREEERTRIAREIHDDLGQTLTALKMDCYWLDGKLKTLRDDGLRTLLLSKTSTMLELIDATIQTVQRIASDLRPGILDNLGLAAALEWQVQEFARRLELTCHFQAAPPDLQVARAPATALLRICQEALTNVARHAQARRVEVTLQGKGKWVILQVKDDGRGIEAENLGKQGSLGLVGMRERAQQLGGELEIEGAPGAGVTVTVRLPWEQGA